MQYFRYRSTWRPSRIWQRCLSSWQRRRLLWRNQRERSCIEGSTRAPKRRFRIEVQYLEKIYQWEIIISNTTSTLRLDITEKALGLNPFRMEQGLYSEFRMNKSCLEKLSVKESAVLWLDVKPSIDNFVIWGRVESMHQISRLIAHKMNQGSVSLLMQFYL